MRRYELWLGVRFLFARRRERFVSVIAALSIGGVALGVAALLVVLSVMSGFDHDITQKLVGMNAHLVVDQPGGVRDAEEVLRLVGATEHVVGASPFVSGQAIIRLPDRALGVLVRGIDPAREPRISRLGEYVIMGRLPEHDRELLLGSELAAEVLVGPGETLRLISPADGRLHEFIVSGIFRSGMYEYDTHLVAMTLSAAQRLYHLEGIVSGVGVKVDRLEHAEQVKAALEEGVGPYEVRTWMEQNQTLFDALKLEKVVMFVILTLIILVAAANIISTLIMMVIEKTRDIGILKSVGATSASVYRLFTLQGLLVGVIGTVLGVGLAAGIVWALATYEFIKLPSTVYYLDHLPVRAEWLDWWLTIAAALVISLASTVYPAWQAARLAPVDALRYE